MNTLPGFLVTIEDNQKQSVEVTPVKDVHVIYAVLPEIMKYKDEDGNLYDKYIEPNKPMLIANGGKIDAVTTLALSDIELTREVRNMVSLMPNDVPIALCRIVTRDGEQPDENDLVSMYEALDFAFESTENYQMARIYCAGISLNKAVALVPNEFSIKTLSNTSEIFDEQNVKALFTDIGNYTGTKTVTTSKNVTVGVSVERADNSMTEPNGKGIFNKLTISVNGKPAMVSAEDGSTVPFEVIFKINYDGESPVVQESIVPTGVTASMVLLDSKLSITLAGSVKLVLDNQSVIFFNGTTITINDLGKTTQGLPNKQDITLSLRKVSSTADILGRILSHVYTITSTQNNCLVFMAPEPPKNASIKAIEEYVNITESLYDKIRDRCASLVTANGKKADGGMYLNVPVGVNRIDSIGGVIGFPQSTIATIEDTKIVTQKVTTAFERGDLVEVYTNNKLDIDMIQAKVVSVTISATNTTEITLDTSIPESITGTKNPKYIMNVNNKDFNGNYMAIQYSNVCQKVGVKRSPAGIAWDGECQIMFSDKQRNRLNAKKFAVLMQRYGTVQGEIDKSQLMTGIKSQFQDFENIAVVYELIKGSKEIVMKYKGERISDGTQLAVIKTEIDGQVFAPASKVFIEPGYNLKLSSVMLQAPNGKKEKALLLDFEVTEVQTLKVIRMRARLI